MTATLVSITDNAEERMAQMARVSSKNPQNSNTRLLKYLIDNKHWSPFEMCHMTVKIETTRDISRQIIRHRSFSFQEFSQRYQNANLVMSQSGGLVCREARLQDLKNRQNSIETENKNIMYEWDEIQKDVWAHCIKKYDRVISMGIAKEQARVLLPEGLTKTVMYMSGTIRSWIHYIDLRSGNGTQKEHADLAKKIKIIFINELPTCAESMGWIPKRAKKKRRLAKLNPEKKVSTLPEEAAPPSC